MGHHLTSGLVAIVLIVSPLRAQTSPTEQIQVRQPSMSRVDPPSPTQTPEQLERQGDELRATKAYLDAIDYYQAALAKKRGSAAVYNKIGISHLLLQHFKEAQKNFDRATKLDRNFPDAYNNLGVVSYLTKKYGKAIRYYEKAIALRPDSASYFGNLGAAYFSKKDWERSTQAYSQAVALDPDIFDRVSHTGVAGQISSPEDRSRFEYVLAKLYAKNGLAERSLQCLRKAMEEGYKGIEDVYKDAEFTELRKDPRFAELMSARPTALP